MSGTAQKHLLIGLTGGIGCGKSTVSALFKKFGVRIIDTDELSRELTQSGGAAIAQIRNAFGVDYIDTSGALDRARMRELIFSHPAEKQRLEAIIHPLILKQTQELAQAATSAPYTLLVIPLLFETQSYRNWLSRILVVDCPEDLQIERTMQRSGLDRRAVESIMAQQIARSERLALTDDVICNDGDLSALSNRVTRLHQQYLTLTSGSD